MKEDILEQLVDDYLKAKGYFTRHNIKFRPEKGDPDFDAKTDSVNSDIDVLAINPNISGPGRVIVVTCKSWQDGLRPEKLIDAFNRDLKIPGRPAWKGFREITRKKWANAFCRKVLQTTGSDKFLYLTVVTKVVGDKKLWESNQSFSQMLNGNLIQIKTVNEILDELVPMIDTTVESSQIGRLLQVIKASGWK